MLSKIFNLKKIYGNDYEKIPLKEVIEKDQFIIPKFTDNKKKWNWLNEKIDCKEVHNIIREEIKKLYFSPEDNIENFEDIPVLLKNKKIIEYDLFPIIDIYYPTMDKMFLNKNFIKILDETNDIEINIEKYQKILLNVCSIAELNKYATIMNYILVHKKKIITELIEKNIINCYCSLSYKKIDDDNNLINEDLDNILLLHLFHRKSGHF